MRQLVSTALVALVVAALTAMTVGATAQQPTPLPAGLEPASVTPAGLNADTVDGKHAVSATTKKGKRANRLVAADAAGYLPSNIVKPRWDLIGGKPTGFADGVDDIGYVMGVADCGATIPMSGSQWVMFANLPSDMVHQFWVVPTSGEGWLEARVIESGLTSNGTLTTYVEVVNNGAMDPAGSTCQIRRISFYGSMATAKARAESARVEVSTSRKRPKL